jgi:hypothetical protein
VGYFAGFVIYDYFYRVGVRCRLILVGVPFSLEDSDQVHSHTDLTEHVEEV